MSIQSLANTLQAQGRGNDSMLIHMSPNEVGGLQALAAAHGGSLTTNPTTGLPEANFLEAILPTVIGLGITAATGGAAAPWMVGLGVGGGTALLTGDLNKGLMAGLGAFGGAGLGNTLMGMGAGGGAGALGALGDEAVASGLMGSGADIASATTPGFGASLSQMGSGVGQAMANPGTFGSNLVANLGGNFGATAAGLGTLGGFEETNKPDVVEPTISSSPYEGPYTPPERQVSYPEAGSTSSAEFNYFSPSNPVPGYQTFADGGMAQGFLTFGGQAPTSNLDFYNPDSSVFRNELERIRAQGRQVAGGIPTNISGMDAQGTPFYENKSTISGSTINDLTNQFAEAIAPQVSNYFNLSPDVKQISAEAPVGPVVPPAYDQPLAPTPAPTPGTPPSMLPPGIMNPPVAPPVQPPVAPQPQPPVAPPVTQPPQPTPRLGIGDMEREQMQKPVQTPPVMNKPNIPESTQDIIRKIQEQPVASPAPQPTPQKPAQETKPVPKQDVDRIKQTQEAMQNRVMPTAPAKSKQETADLVRMESLTSPFKEDIAKAYKNQLGRSVDPEGLQYWANQMQGGMNFNQLQSALKKTDEGQAYNNYLRSRNAKTGINQKEAEAAWRAFNPEGKYAAGGMAEGFQTFGGIAPTENQYAFNPDDPTFRNELEKIRILGRQAQAGIPMNISGIDSKGAPIYEQSYTFKTPTGEDVRKAGDLLFKDMSDQDMRYLKSVLDINPSPETQVNPPSPSGPPVFRAPGTTPTPAKPSVDFDAMARLMKEQDELKQKQKDKLAQEQAAKNVAQPVVEEKKDPFHEYFIAPFEQFYGEAQPTDLYRNANSLGNENASGGYIRKAEGGLASIAPGGEFLSDGSFVIDARTVAELGNGSSNAGLELLMQLGGRPVDGPGDGVSDSIPATIDGERPAAVARDEVIFDPDAVAKLGGGDPEKGAKRLYSLMRKAEQARKQADRGENSGVGIEALRMAGAV